MSSVKKASGSNKKARKKKVKNYSRKTSPGKNGARGKKTAPKAKKGRKFPLKVTITFPDLFPRDIFDFGILRSFFRRFTKGLDLEVSCTSGQNSERNSKKRKSSKKGKNKSDRMFCGLFKKKKKNQAKKKAPGIRVTTKS